MFRQAVLAQLDFLENNRGRATRNQAQQASVDAPSLEILSHKFSSDVVTQARKRHSIPSQECEASDDVSTCPASVKFRRRVIKTKYNIQSAKPCCYYP